MTNAYPTLTEGPAVTAFEPLGEPFLLLKRAGEREYRVSFQLGALRFEESTLCDELDLAVMVARATYALTADLLAGKRLQSASEPLRPTDRPSIRPAA